MEELKDGLQELVEQNIVFLRQSAAEAFKSVVQALGSEIAERSVTDDHRPLEQGGF